MKPNITLLLIEDNLAIAKQIVEFLEGLKWRVDYASTGKAGVALALENTFDVILLDLNLPDIDGLEVCNQIKAKSSNNPPILMLTARDAFEDKARGFQIGADDYLTKPFDFRELALRCEAMARRAKLHKNQILQRGHMKLDVRAMKVFWNNQQIAVTKIGFQILNKLLENYPYPVGRSEIIQSIWGDEPPESNALKSHMYALRKALDKVSDEPVIQTISNIGYQLANLEE